MTNDELVEYWSRKWTSVLDNRKLNVFPIYDKCVLDYKAVSSLPYLDRNNSISDGFGFHLNSLRAYQTVATIQDTIAIQPPQPDATKLNRKDMIPAKALNSYLQFEWAREDHNGDTNQDSVQKATQDMLVLGDGLLFDTYNVVKQKYQEYKGIDKKTGKMVFDKESEHELFRGNRLIYADPYRYFPDDYATNEKEKEFFIYKLNPLVEDAKAEWSLNKDADQKVVNALIKGGDTKDYGAIRTLTDALFDTSLLVNSSNTITELKGYTKRINGIKRIADGNPDATTILWCVHKKHWTYLGWTEDGWKVLLTHPNPLPNQAFPLVAMKDNEINGQLNGISEVYLLRHHTTAETKTLNLLLTAMYISIAPPLGVNSIGFADGDKFKLAPWAKVKLKPNTQLAINQMIAPLYQPQVGTLPANMMDYIKNDSQSTTGITDQKIGQSMQPGEKPTANEFMTRSQNVDARIKAKSSKVERAIERCLNNWIQRIPVYETSERFFDLIQEKMSVLFYPEPNFLLDKAGNRVPNFAVYMKALQKAQDTYELPLTPNVLEGHKLMIQQIAEAGNAKDYDLVQKLTADFVQTYPENIVFSNDLTEGTVVKIRANSMMPVDKQSTYQKLIAVSNQLITWQQAGVKLPVDLWSELTIQLLETIDGLDVQGLIPYEILRSQIQITDPTGGQNQNAGNMPQAVDGQGMPKTDYQMNKDATGQMSQDEQLSSQVQPNQGVPQQVADNSLAQ